MKRCMGVFLWILLAAGCAVCVSAWAQVATDGTVGPARDLAGPDFRIDSELGKQAGGNLFHSFSRFSVNSGQSATFMGPNSVANIIGRVTGGERSSIDGPLRSEIGGANLFFLNPAGVMFGPGASLDIGGSFFVSTADYLELGDGGRFDAADPGASRLTAAPPSAFGFVDDDPAGISFDGSFLEVADGEAISVVGGDVGMKDATLFAGGGQVNIVAAGSEGEAGIDGSRIDGEGFGKYGEVSVLREAEHVRLNENLYYGDIETSGMEDGQTGGRVYIRGGKIEMDSASVSADTKGGDGGGIVIRGDDEVNMKNIYITTIAKNEGKAGDISIKAENLNLSKSRIYSYSEGGGDAGDMDFSISDSLV